MLCFTNFCSPELDAVCLEAVCGQYREHLQLLQRLRLTVGTAERERNRKCHWSGLTLRSGLISAYSVGEIRDYITVSIDLLH